MRLVNFKRDAETKFGVERDGFVFPLAAAGYDSDATFIAGGEDALAAAREVLADSGAKRFALGEVQLLAPVTQPGKILCVGLNYRDHAVESGMEIPKVPTVFLKLPNAVTGPGADIVLPANSTQPDYEAELAAVIGKGGKDIRAEDWEQHILGYTILNDVSARDVQLATSQWTLGKSFNTFCPMGPAIVTKDEVRDPHALDIQLAINGETLQHSNTRELIFKLPQLIAHLSAIVPLEPGDIISTGTPAGVGLGREPKRWLKPGEEIVITIDGIGQLRNRTVAASA
ncbi:MAG: fumarylacetoacetate hydrolase family protein [Acidobacteria bacterium]|jgi:2-keto-4-pentenoate hydratase/2-oxohepta-3-ene-1,7-dioic acid hydratase in catechol pathway|nr:fumarylacetoacetate hydrolase family protein [Acidobacteriota bacterium]